MEQLNSHPAVDGAINAFFIGSGANLPASVRDKLMAATAAGSIVDRMVNVAETLYANRDVITNSSAKTAAMTLAAQCAIWAANPANNFHDMGAAGDSGVSRGVAIYWAMARELGETAPTGSEWPAAGDDPAAKPDWTVAAE